ncbi:hypothetical protein ACVWZ6_006966 [Bradyrhizobium sp. GM6.1]
MARLAPADATCCAIGLLRQASKIKMLVRTWSSRPAMIVSMSIIASVILAPGLSSTSTGMR